MHPPEAYVEAVRDATRHIQLAIDAVELLPGRARLSGSVVRVFRGGAEPRGTRLALEVPCRPAGAPFAPGASSRFPPEALRAGRVLEALLNDGPDGPEIPLELCMLLDAATDSPQLPLEFRAPPRRRWGAVLGIGAGLTAAGVVAYLIAR